MLAANLHDDRQRVEVEVNPTDVYAVLALCALKRWLRKPGFAHELEERALQPAFDAGQLHQLVEHGDAGAALAAELDEAPPDLADGESATH